MLEFRHEHPVFTVKRHRKQMLRGVLTGIEELLANVVDVGDEVGDRSLRCHGSVLEGNPVGDHTVTEDDGDFPALVTRHHPRCCKVGGVLNVNELAVAVRGLLENLFIGDHPLDTNIGHGFDHRRRNRFFTRPHACRPEAKFSLEQIHARNEVVLHVFWPRLFVDPNTVFHGPTVHHQEGHDGMVVRRGGQFHLPVGRQFAVHGKHVPHVLVLSIEDVGEIGQVVVAVLHEQGDEALIAMTGIVGSQDVIR